MAIAKYEYISGTWGTRMVELLICSCNAANFVSLSDVSSDNLIYLRSLFQPYVTGVIGPDDKLKNIWSRDICCVK